MFKYSFSGSSFYYAWLISLSFFILVGLIAYTKQLEFGLVVTGMSDSVSWGVYIANFTFLVGVAAASVLLVTPSYVFKNSEIKKVVIYGELLAVSAIVMALCFIMVDLGRPDRMLHILPFFGKLNFPQSILAWDVVVLSIYLILNLHIPGFLLYKKYLGHTPTKKYFLPIVFISILWALSIHTVTAFLYSGLSGRPFWNSAILAPRFLVSAFAVGPAILTLIFKIMGHYGKLPVPSSVYSYLRTLIIIFLPINLFLFSCEIFKEFYSETQHSQSATYLFFGIGEAHQLVPYIWSAITLSVVGLFLVLWLKKNSALFYFALLFIIIGVWIEKGMGLVIPGFIPSPTGAVVEYSPTRSEIAICLGIWALGIFLFTLMSKVALGIQTGALSQDSIISSKN